MTQVIYFLVLPVLITYYYSSCFALKVDNLKISVYYESYCPDSIDFMMKQLAPMMGEFNKYPDWLIMDLVPFGNAKKAPLASMSKYICQHGPKECAGNKLHACAIDLLITQQAHSPLMLRLANFIYCEMYFKDQINVTVIQQCTAQTGVDYQQLMSCNNGPKGDTLIDVYANRTFDFKPKITWVPTVVFNDKFNQTLSDMAQKDLYAVVCSLRPQVCE